MQACRVLFAMLLFVVPSLSQTIDTFSGAVVLLHKMKPQPVIKNGKPVVKNGKAVMEPKPEGATGFFVTPDNEMMILVTAEHVATEMKSDFRATIRDENDTPFDMSSEDLTGTKAVIWVSHSKEDVAVTILHPAKAALSKLTGRFIPRKFIFSDDKPPGRERTLTTLGFPLMLGATEHFSPISRESKAVSGLITLARADTHTPATFFLLDNPSIAGFSGAPVLLFPTPYAIPGGMMAPEVGGPNGAIAQCVGIVHGTINDDTGGKMAAITPSIYILETIDKALKH